MSPKKESYETMNQKELLEELKHADEKDAQGFVEREVSSDSSLRRLAPQWSRRTLSVLPALAA